MKVQTFGIALALFALGHAGTAYGQLRTIRQQAPALPPPTMIPTEGARQSALPYNAPPVSPILARPNLRVGGYIGGYFPYYFNDYGYGNGYNTINYNTFNINVPQNYVPPRNFATPEATANEFPNVARLTLQVPVNAEVTVNGKKLDIAGSRTIESPELKGNDTYTFDVKVTWMQVTKQIEEKRTLTMKAGDLQSLQYLAMPQSMAKVQ